MPKFKLITKSLFKRKLESLLIILELTITMVFLVHSFIQIRAYSYNEDMIKKYLNNDPNKVIHVSLLYFNQSDIFVNNFMELEKFINEIPHVKGFGGYHFLGTSFPELKENKEFINLKKSITKGTIYEQNPERTSLLRIDKGVYNLISLNVIKGNNFTERSFDETQEVLPLLAGSKYLNVLDMGQIITDSFTGAKYKIIGFIDNNSVWFKGHSYYSEMMVNLDDKFIGPFAPSDKTNALPLMAKAESFFCIVDDSKNLETVSHIINAKANSLNLKVSTVSISNDLKNYKASNREIFRFNLFIGGFLAIMSLFSVISLTISSILNRKREFGIRIMAGASPSYIKLWVAFEILILMTISSIISILYVLYDVLKTVQDNNFRSVLSNPRYSFTPNIILIIILSVLMLSILAAIIPVLKINKLQPKELIGGID